LASRVAAKGNLKLLELRLDCLPTVLDPLPLHLLGTSNTSYFLAAASLFLEDRIKYQQYDIPEQQTNRKDGAN